MPQRLGILGGTFDPVHFGHLRTAQEALEAFKFDRMMFMPAADPPHKPNQQITLFAHRCKMLQIAVGDNNKFEVCDLEQRLSGKSYTVITLNRLLESSARDIELYFLVGMDSFLELDTWWHYRELFQLTRLVVLKRPGFPEEEMESLLRGKVSDGYRWDRKAGFYRHPWLLPVYCLRNTCLEISSTQIRRLLREGRSVRYLVPRGVLGYIEEQNIYRLVDS